MEPSSLILYTVSRFLHVGTAIVLVGGVFFLRFVLMPAAKVNLPDDLHSRLRTAVMGTWKRIVHGGIGLLLLTGSLNYYRVWADGTHKGDPLYSALLGIKILLALVIFFIASVLVGRSAKFEGMRQNAAKWLAINLALAAVIVVISGFLKVRGVPVKVAPMSTTAVESVSTTPWFPSSTWELADRSFASRVMGVPRVTLCVTG